ncbi:MAG: hypothetical protein K0S61_4245 [Anaerocolumna sp.]|jgi:hypothetical protein|nr:hypothetical protein [Anaerocolumna sp.]
MEITLVYPEDEKDVKDIEIDSTELIALCMSNKIGSDGRYYRIKDKIFEDLTPEKNKAGMTLILEKDS